MGRVRQMGGVGRWRGIGLAGVLLLGLAQVLPAYAWPEKAKQAAPQKVAMTPVSLKPLPYSMPVPTAWKKEKSDTNFRLIQYQIPSAGKAGVAEFVVFYFGEDQGGPVDANIMRWQSQFSSPDGKPVEPVVGRYKMKSGLRLTTVSLTGTYARGVGVGPVGTPMPNQTLLVGVYETPKGNVTIQLHGPRATIDANRDAFSDMVLGFK